MQFESSSLKKTVVWILVFSIAMALLEAIVVVYLREMANIGSELFPLKQISTKIFLTEILRETTTIIMLISISAIAGKNFYQRFAFFLMCFGVWDIFYYIWLKVLIDWPSSFMTWDVLFLIPTVWIGPVIAPIICSVTMIFLSFVILHNCRINYSFKLKIIEWISTLIGAAIILFTFIYDYGKLVIQNGLGDELNKIIAAYTPTQFNWLLFLIGETIILISILRIAAIKKH